MKSSYHELTRNREFWYTEVVTKWGDKSKYCLFVCEGRSVSTRSYIAQVLDDGTYRAIYCHWGGDPDENGIRLSAHYNTQDKVNTLIDLGDISSLGETTDDTVAYHRDRGEDWDDVHPRVTTSRSDLEKQAQDDDAEYLYTWSDQRWIAYDLDQKRYLS